jgi:uncharacterized membrane protein YbhN (UPF0104 family)
MYISTFAMHGMDLQNIGLGGCFLLQSMSGLAYIMPAPGGTGTYHFLISQSLVAIFGIPPEAAIAFATLTHASNYVCTTVVGFIFMIADGVSMTSVREQTIQIRATRRPTLQRNERHAAAL